MARGRPSRSDVYSRLDSQIAELWQRMGGLPSPIEAKDIWRDIWVAEAHHSTAIEGNTLVFREVEELLAEGRAVGQRLLSEYMEVRGYADAADWVYMQAQAHGVGDRPIVSLHEIREVHRLAMHLVWDVNPHPDASDDEGPGNFRRHEIVEFPAGMKPITWPHVHPELSGWVDAANDLKPRTRLFPEEIARLHCRFEQIHPFLDGNGRTGRLVMNLLLVRCGYPPAIVFKNDRTRYLRALRRADTGDAGALGEFIARAILENLYKFIVPVVAGPARLVPLTALATERIKIGALRAAAVRGTLQATKGADGQWRSSRNWVDEYIATRHRRR